MSILDSILPRLDEMNKKLHTISDRISLIDKIADTRLEGLETEGMSEPPKPTAEEIDAANEADKRAQKIADIMWVELRHRPVVKSNLLLAVRVALNEFFTDTDAKGDGLRQQVADLELMVKASEQLIVAATEREHEQTQRINDGLKREVAMLERFKKKEMGKNTVIEGVFEVRSVVEALIGKMKITAQDHEDDIAFFEEVKNLGAPVWTEKRND